MNIELPVDILKHTAATEINEHKYFKDGIEIEKGAILTSNRIEKNRELYEKMWDYWSIYPDLFIDFITPSKSHFKLFIYQRMFLRMCMRYGRVFVIACRAFSKSFISILALILMCIFRPGGKYFIVAPGKARIDCALLS